MADAINPAHYRFSNGVELIDITENLNSNGGQAVGYVTRSTRSDGRNKGTTPAELIEDLKKARWFVDREITRLQQEVPVVDRLARRWDRIADVPQNLVVVDGEGDRTEFRDGRWKYLSGGVWYTQGDHHAPFTEVV